MHSSCDAFPRSIEQRAIVIELKDVGKQVGLRACVRGARELALEGQLLERYFESRAQKVSRGMEKAMVTSSPFEEALRAL